MKFSLKCAIILEVRVVRTHTLYRSNRTPLSSIAIIYRGGIVSACSRLPLKANRPISPQFRLHARQSQSPAPRSLSGAWNPRILFPGLTCLFSSATNPPFMALDGSSVRYFPSVPEEEHGGREGGEGRKGETERFVSSSLEGWVTVSAL